MFHSIKRTSPKGGEFVGTCTLCGKPGLKFADIGEVCSAEVENVRQGRPLVFNTKDLTLTFASMKDD